jgi:hypothetical protein
MPTVCQATHTLTSSLALPIQLNFVPPDTRVISSFDRSAVEVLNPDYAPVVSFE